MVREGFHRTILFLLTKLPTVLPAMPCVQR